MQKERIEWIDTAKGICIILVVFNHILLFQGFPTLYPKTFSFANDFLSSFRMPLYFFLSGVFFKTYGGGLFFIRKKTNKILIPFVFWYIFGGLIIPFIITGWGENTQNLLSNKFYIFDFYYNDCHSTNGPIWFLLCLFEVNLLFCSIHIFFKEKAMVYILSFLIGVVGICLSSLSINLHASLDTAMTCLPFFAFGYIIKKETNILGSSFLDKHLFLYAFICGIVCFFLADEVSYFRNSYSPHSYYTLYICGILGTMMVILFAKQIGTIPIVTYIGKYSIIVLCTHYLLYIGLNHYIFNIFENGLIKMLCIFFTIVIIELAIIPLLIKYLPYVTAQKDLL